MRPLLMWRSDWVGGGGGAVAMFRLLNGLRRAGVHARILAEKRTTDSEFVDLLPSPTRGERYLRKFTSRLGLNDVHRIGSFRIPELPVFQRSDVLHFHGTHGGYINYLALPAMTRSKPAVFTLHDMWAVTGHCAFSNGCDRWKTGCGKCPHPEAHPAIRRDATRWEWSLKRRVYERSDLTVIAPSRWIASVAREGLLSRFPIHHIPYGIDVEVYRPLERDLCRSVLGVPPGKKVLMFAAASLHDTRKGLDLLYAALREMPASLRRECVLLLLGEGGPGIAEAAGIPAIQLGYLGPDGLKAMAYSAADLFIAPSRSDNSPLVTLESIACGTPVLAFRVGGVPDVVRAGETGYLAEPGEPAHLREGITALLEDDTARLALGEQARRVAVAEFSLDLHVRRHIEVYGGVLTAAA